MSAKTVELSPQVYEHVENSLRILGIDIESGVTWDLINSKYRQLVKEYHPDIGGDPKKFQIIDRAKNYLEKGFKGVPKNQVIQFGIEKPKIYQKPTKSAVPERDTFQDRDFGAPASGATNRTLVVGGTIAALLLVAAVGKNWYDRFNGPVMAPALSGQLEANVGDDTISAFWKQREHLIEDLLAVCSRPFEPSRHRSEFQNKVAASDHSQRCNDIGATVDRTMEFVAPRLLQQ